ncbi:MAG TPA: ATP-binding cassette domain-containing protein [Chromatiaceae bacterium]|nr:ATP-binding cassette domain-containing protein [Chromatiaceae bacterium]
MLKFSNLALRRGPRLLFERVNHIVHAGQRWGVTGGNGTGKSSLFALILQHIDADEGEFSLSDAVVIAHVAQESPTTNQGAIDYVMDGDTELREIEQRLADANQLGDGNLEAELHGRLQHIGGYEARARAAKLMHGLGFKVSEDERAVSEFSGGWRMRLNLARALMCRSDLLLLDEPTNHLDLDAVIWLEAWLRGYAGTLLLISHDREFLDSVVDHIAHVEQQTITFYTGNYSVFEQLRAERLAHQQSSYQRQQREIAHIHSYVERFRAKATKARQAQSRLKALARMEMIAPAHINSPFHFEFRSPRVLPASLLRLDRVSTGYGEQEILTQIRCSLLPGDRVGLLGPNGAGKSTLIKLLAAQLAVMSGQRDDAKDLAIGYFEQHQLEQLDLEATPLLHMQRLDGRATEKELRNFLGGFGFQGDRVTELVAPLSGGEKARLVLAMVVWQQPNLLLLDEPTNHLDLEMRHALTVALQGYAGAVVLVSHDRHLLRTVCDELWLVDDGAVGVFDQDLDAYAQWLVQRRRDDVDEVMDATESDNSAVARKERKRVEAEQRKAVEPLRRREKSLEAKVNELTALLQELEMQLADAAIYDADRKQDLQELLRRQADTKQLLGQAEDDWMEVSSQLEGI